jgi:nitrosocyanin
MRRLDWRIDWGFFCILTLGTVSAAPPAKAADATREFTVANVEFEGTKMFVPSVLVVHKGDMVKITIVNDIQSEPPNHGFAISEFKVEEVVNRGETKEVEFTADKAGIFDIKCHLHPAHVHGQLVVHE